MRHRGTAGVDAAHHAKAVARAFHIERHAGRALALHHAHRQRLLELVVVGAHAAALPAQRDVGLLQRGYISDPHQAIGRKLTRSLQADQVLTPAILQLAEIVRRGDQVVITARSGGISVRMQGEALSGGSSGQQISVRNLSSQRVVRARVTGPGQVEVEM